MSNYYARIIIAFLLPNSPIKGIDAFLIHYKSELDLSIGEVIDTEVIHIMFCYDAVLRNANDFNLSEAVSR